MTSDVDGNSNGNGNDSSEDGQLDRWIVGIDGSDHAHAALRWAVTHATGRSIEVVALSTYHVPVGLSLLMAKRAFDVDRLGIEATVAHDVDVAIEAVTTGSAASAVDLRPRVVDGHPGQTLVDESADADLLVVGQRGAGAARHTVLGILE